MFASYGQPGVQCTVSHDKKVAVQKLLFLINEVLLDFNYCGKVYNTDFMDIMEVTSPPTPILTLIPPVSYFGPSSQGPYI